jgi:AsmA protein
MTDSHARPRRWPRILAVIVLVVALLGAAASFALDRFITSAARGRAVELSKAWGRPVEIGAVKTTLLTGLGVRVEGVKIGAAAGESRALVELDRAEVRLALLRAVRSGGKELRVKSAELRGLRVVVVKRRDGTTNLEQLSQAMAKGTPEPSQPASEAGEKPADLSSVHVEHAALLDGRIAFVDDGAGGKELAVEAIELEVNGLAAGRPLELLLRAGLLSPKQNLEVRVHAPPLPQSLVPSPDRVTLRVEPVDLTPLAPFAPASAGFRGGGFSADLEVALGAAVPGGEGPTTVRGGFSATALRFAGQEGGRALDVRLDADLVADAKKGDLSIAKLLLAFGPATLEGKGKVTGLLSESPRIDGLRIVSRDLDLAALVPYYPPLATLIGGTVAGPIALSVAAAGTSARPVVELRVDLTAVRISMPKQLEKAPGGKLLLTARVHGGPAGALRFDAEGDLTGLDLRPGGSIAKKSGDRLTFARAATRSVAGPSQKVELSSFTLALLDTNLTARGSTEWSPRSTRFDVDVELDRVNVDRLLIPSPSKDKKSHAPKPGSKRAGGPASGYAGLSGRAALRIGELLVEKQRMTDVRVTVSVKEDELTVQEGRLGLWDGLVSVTGSKARLAPADQPFELAARVEHAEVGGALAAFTDKKILTGKLDAEVKLSGKGETSDQILEALDGTIDGRLVDGLFHGKDLVAGVGEPIAKAIPALGGKFTRGGKTSLGKAVPVSLRIRNGGAQLQKPLEFEERGASTKVQGSFAFDGELDMPTTLTLSPGAVSELTGGRAKVDAPLPFSFRLAGKAWSPRLAGLDVAPAVRIIGEQVGAALLGKALGLPGTPQAAAKEKAAEVKEQAKEKAQDAAKKLEKDARKQLKGLFR